MIRGSQAPCQAACPYAGFPAIDAELDLLEADDRIAHDIRLSDDELKAQTELDIFRPDPDFDKHQEQWQVGGAPTAGCASHTLCCLQQTSMLHALGFSSGLMIQQGRGRPGRFILRMPSSCILELSSDCLQCKAAQLSQSTLPKGCIEFHAGNEDRDLGRE